MIKKILKIVKKVKYYKFPWRWKSICKKNKQNTIILESITIILSVLPKIIMVKKNLKLVMQ